MAKFLPKSFLLTASALFNPIYVYFTSLFYAMWASESTVTSWKTKNVVITSKVLQRDVKLMVIVPYHGSKAVSNLPLLLSNDGQDFTKMKLPNTLADLHTTCKIPAFLLVGIYCNHDRMHEYGTASQADYAGRGSKAGLHTRFVLEELLPYLASQYSLIGGSENTYFMGFSLGGLSAMDIVWHHPAQFSKVGAFSPSFWWRQKPYEEGYDEDNDRIMHNLIRNGTYKQGMQFWFEAGTEDEKEDRNNNGVIDAIDDVAAMMEELEKKHYKREEDFVYYEIQGGTHDVKTWERAIPVFLEWAFKK